MHLKVQGLGKELRAAVASTEGTSEHGSDPLCRPSPRISDLGFIHRLLSSSFLVVYI